MVAALVVVGLELRRNIFLAERTYGTAIAVQARRGTGVVLPTLRRVEQRGMQMASREGHLR